jgi:hypothetical protein
MNNNELLTFIEAAMDCIADDEAGGAMLALYRVHRKLSSTTSTLTIRPDSREPAFIHAKALAEARASVALDGDTYSLEGNAAEALRREHILAKDRARKQRDRDLAKAVGDLPKMKPINGRVLTIVAREVPCPTCHQKAGQQCLKMTHAGKGGEPIPGTYVKTFHMDRKALARKQTEKFQAKADAKPMALIDMIEQAKRAEAGEG